MTAPLPQCQPDSEHTPTPWRAEEESSGTLTRILSPDGIMLVHAHSYPKYSAAFPDGEVRQANAAFIVEAVNSHAALKSRVEELTKALEPFANAWKTYGDKPSIDTRLADNNGGAYLEACLLTFRDLYRASLALSLEDRK